MSKVLQCFICREWNWDVSRCFRESISLCMPCYVDVLEVRQARGAMGMEHSGRLGDDGHGPRAGPGRSPSSLTEDEKRRTLLLQLELFN